MHLNNWKDCVGRLLGVHREAVGTIYLNVNTVGRTWQNTNNIWYNWRYWLSFSKTYLCHGLAIFKTILSEVICQSSEIRERSFAEGPIPEGIPSAGTPQMSLFSVSSSSIDSLPLHIFTAGLLFQDWWNWALGYYRTLTGH